MVHDYILLFGEFQAFLLLINNSNPVVYNLREHKDQGEAFLISNAFACNGFHNLSTGRNKQLEKFLFGWLRPVHRCLARNEDKQLSGVVDYP